MSKRSKYEEALDALRDAHKACFENDKRSLVGMSYGPFSGVNKTLGIVIKLESENNALFVDFWARSCP